MDTLLDPVRSTLLQAGAQALTLQKQMLDAQRAQAKVAEETTLAGMKFARVGFDIAADFATNASRTLVSAYAPKTEGAAKAPSAS